MVNNDVIVTPEYSDFPIEATKIVSGEPRKLPPIFLRKLNVGQIVVQGIPVRVRNVGAERVFWMFHPENCRHP